MVEIRQLLDQVISAAKKKNDMALFRFCKKQIIEDSVIELLRLGKERIEKDKGITQEEINKIFRLENNYFKGLFISNYLDENFLEDPDEKGVHFLKSEGYFRLIQYDSLKQARESACRSMIAAIVAIAIAIASFLVPIVFFNNKPKEVIILNSEHLQDKFDSLYVKNDTIFLHNNSIECLSNSFDTIAIETAIIKTEKP